MKSKPNSKQWRVIKAEYQKGEGSMRELAEKFNVSISTMEKRAIREQWSVLKRETSRKLDEKVAEVLVDEATAWVKDTIYRGKRARKIIDAGVEQFATDEQGRPVIDMLNVNTMMQAESKADDLTRRALGLPDAPQKVEHSGNVTYEIVSPYAKPEEDKNTDQV